MASPSAWNVLQVSGREQNLDWVGGCSRVRTFLSVFLSGYFCPNPVTKEKCPEDYVCPAGSSKPQSCGHMFNIDKKAQRCVASVQLIAIISGSTVGEFGGGRRDLAAYLAARRSSLCLLCSGRGAAFIAGVSPVQAVFKEQARRVRAAAGQGAEQEAGVHGFVNEKPESLLSSSSSMYYRG